MKNTILIFCISCFFFSCDRVDPYPPLTFEVIDDEISNGSFLLAPPDQVTTGLASSNFIESHGTISNLTENDLNVSWRKQNLDAPQNWFYSMCDPELCYVPSVESASFILMKDSTELMDVRFYPVNTAGEGEAIILVWLTNDSASSILEMNFSALAE